MDLNMPGMSWQRCLKEFLARNPRAGVFIASGYTAGVQVKDSLESRASAFAANPYKREDLLASVGSVFART
jgi:DNA-binding NarL/FixJ family response regulator